MLQCFSPLAQMLGTGGIQMLSPLRNPVGLLFLGSKASFLGDLVGALRQASKRVPSEYSQGPFPCKSHELRLQKRNGRMDEWVIFRKWQGW